MDCHSLTNDLLLAPTADASDHLSSCPECRDRQKQTALAARALRALTDDVPLPEKNEAAIRAAIPRFAQDAARRKPAGWWSVAAAASLLAAAAIVGSKWSDWRDEPEAKPAGGQVAGGAQSAQPRPPDDGKPIEQPPIDSGTPPPRDGEKGGSATDPVKPPDPKPPEELAVRPGGGTSPGQEVPRVPDEKPPDVAVKPPDEGKPPVQPPLLTSADCLTIMKSVVGESEPVSCDLNGDGRTDVADALLAARAIANKGEH